MCNAISFFVNTKSGKVLTAHPDSHSKTQNLLGLKLTIKEGFSECEWEADKPLVVRHTNTEKAEALRELILADYPERNLLVSHLRPSWERYGHYLVETESDTSRIPAVVKGDIIIKLKDVSLPALTTAGYINAYSATSLSLPALTTAGHIYAGSATSLSLPALTTAGYINARSATSLSLPALTTAGYIDALITAGYIDAPKVPREVINEIMGRVNN